MNDVEQKSLEKQKRKYGIDQLEYTIERYPDFLEAFKRKQEEEQRVFKKNFDLRYES
jgi:hypothetical protein